jgi:ABC-2 type transport system ATP-binding protein
MDAERTSNGGDLAVFASGLGKHFGSVVALDGIDLRVPRGACFGVLGPNGAGKTTTVAILATLLRPDSGTARVLGLDVESQRSDVRREIGIVFQEPSLDRELTAREHLDLHARLYHLDRRLERVRRALDEAGLGPDADRPVRGFSGGMKRRLELARGMLHRPRVLFLDEPTLGLDVAARAAVWERLRELRASGDLTVLLTTHSMEEADALCDSLAILDRGRVVASGSSEALKRELGGDIVTLELERIATVEETLGLVAGVRSVVREADSRARVRVTVEDGSRRLVSLLDAARPFGVVEVSLERPTLEHVFRKHAGRAFERHEGGA